VWTAGVYPINARFDDVSVNGKTLLFAEDSLGSSRVVTDASGVVCYDADFYPYGGERSYTNSCFPNYKFEGKERDTETGNDDFGARYYSNRFGRWLSADWSAVPVAIPYANLANPQTLNLYSMVADDPESFADLDGHCHLGMHSTGACPWFTGDASRERPTCYCQSPPGKADTVIVVTPKKSVWKKLGSFFSGALSAVWRPSSRYTRGIWEKLHGRPWPKDPTTGKNMEADHEQALGDGANPRDPENITPRTHEEHVARHKANGDFRRWGLRQKFLRDLVYKYPAGAEPAEETGLPSGPSEESEP